MLSNGNSNGNSWLTWNGNKKNVFQNVKVNFLSSFKFDFKIPVCILHVCLQILFNLIAVLTLSYLIQKKVFVNKNDIEEEKLWRLISTEIYTTFISNKKLPDPKKKKIQTLIKLINTTKCHSV